jgi:hypothetical protein
MEQNLRSDVESLLAKLYPQKKLAGFGSDYSLMNGSPLSLTMFTRSSEHNKAIDDLTVTVEFRDPKLATKFLKDITKEPGFGARPHYRLINRRRRGGMDLVRAKTFRIVVVHRSPNG